MATNPITFRQAATNAIRFWEPWRILYNLVLALVVALYFFSGMPASRDTFTVNSALFIFLLAVLANVVYCTAYVVDIFAQFTSFSSTWLRLRWLLLVVGILFAAVITRFVAIALFAGTS